MENRGYEQHRESVVQQSELFQSQILADPAQNEETRLQDAYRISMMARGMVDNVEDMIKFHVRSLPKQQPAITYAQATMIQYGLQGILLKQSPNLFGGWEERYCIVKNQRFVYKQEKYPTSLNAGILNFNLLSCKLAIVKDNNEVQYFILSILNCEKRFIFKARTHQQTAQWAIKIQQAIQKSQGYKKQLSYLAHYPRFWRKDYESQNQFRKNVETGDVLLFRGTKNTSVMQRVITGDQYDHVAVALLNERGDLLLFEANGGFGVGICPWNKFVSKKWFQQYDLIVHRHLKVTRSETFLEEVDKFVSKNMGKKYDFSLKQYLFSRKSTGQSEREVFFCSSLVAKLYKKLGLLQQNKSCTQYLPSWFSNKNNHLKQTGRHGSAYFQQQRIIVFQNSS